jgi:hypothetical protein
MLLTNSAKRWERLLKQFDLTPSMLVAEATNAPAKEPKASPAKKPAPKNVAPKKRGTDDDDEFGATPAAKKRGRKAAKAKTANETDDSNEDMADDNDSAVDLDSKDTKEASDDEAFRPSQVQEE